MKTIFETFDNPYTHEDVKMLIENHGGTAEGLDLSGARFEPNIDLSDLNLSGIILKNTIFQVKLIDGNSFGAVFSGSNLEKAVLSGAFIPHAQFGMLNGKPTILHSTDFRNAQLQQSFFNNAELNYAQFQAEVGEQVLRTSVSGADFKDAILYHANFNGCDCLMAKFEGAYIRSSNITESILEDIYWGNYIIGEENKRDYYFAEQCYRHLKAWYKQSGYDEIAAKFYYREREASRKAAKKWCDRISGWFSWAVFGHGERWRRILIWMAGIVLGLGIYYFLINYIWTWSAFWRSLYFSAVSFTAVGYGGWINERFINIRSDWILGLGVTETIVGVFMMALLLVTFVRKWTR